MIFESLDVPDLEAVDVQANLSPVVRDHPGHGLLRLRDEHAAAVAHSLVAGSLDQIRKAAARKSAVVEAKLNQPANDKWLHGQPAFCFAQATAVYRTEVQQVIAGSSVETINEIGADDWRDPSWRRETSTPPFRLLPVQLQVQPAGKGRPRALRGREINMG